MRIYSIEEWPLIPWPHTEEGQKLRSFFEPILKEGISNFVANVETQVYILQVDDVFIPLTVNDKEYSNSYVCSMYSFLLYAEEEMRRHRKHFLRIFTSPVLLFLKYCFRWGKINRLVIVNNYLLSTNLYPSLSAEQVQRMSPFIKNLFPDHAIMFRSLNTFTEANLYHALSKIGCECITSRSVYFFDPKNYPSLPSKKRWIIQKDLKLKNQEYIQILQHDHFQVSDALDIKRLYDLLYLEKYSDFNPAFTVRFFEQAILEKTYILTGIRYKGRLVGVIGFFKNRDVMATPIVGYDTQLPERLGLYRILTALMLEESISSQVIFHMSAGVGHFKRQRGAFQELETMAVICNHLPFHRRFLWKSLAFFLNRIGAPILKKYKL